MCMELKHLHNYFTCTLRKAVNCNQFWLICVQADVQCCGTLKGIVAGAVRVYLKTWSEKGTQRVCEKPVALRTEFSGIVNGASPAILTRLMNLSTIRPLRPSETVLIIDKDITNNLKLDRQKASEILQVRLGCCFN